jgi:hypothetical protein
MEALFRPVISDIENLLRTQVEEARRKKDATIDVRNDFPHSPYHFDRF